MRRLKIAVACGGTGGHIFPGLAVARVLKERGHDAVLWMAGKDIENEAIAGWDGEVITIPSRGFQPGLSWRSVKTSVVLLRACLRATSLMRQQKLDALLAMGGYASFGPVTASRRLGIPYVLHEANLLPGRAVSLLARDAAAIAVSFEKTRHHLKHQHIKHTGMPLSSILEEAASRPRLARPPGAPFHILVTGGSRGAQVLNEMVPQALRKLAARSRAPHVVHVVGLPADRYSIEQVYRESGIEAEVLRFVDNMHEFYLRSDLAICRAGAATCAELCAFGLPALLVPYPHAVRDHQMGNARMLQDAGAADVVAQEGLTADRLCDGLIRFLEAPERLERMARSAKCQARIKAAEQVADLLEQVAA